MGTSLRWSKMCILILKLVFCLIIETLKMLKSWLGLLLLIVTLTNTLTIVLELLDKKSEKAIWGGLETGRGKVCVIYGCDYTHR